MPHGVVNGLPYGEVVVSDMKCLNCMLICTDENALPVARIIEEMVKEKLIDGAEVVAYSIEQQPDLMTGQVAWEDRSIQ